MTKPPPVERSCKSTLDNIAAAQAAIDDMTKREKDRKEFARNMILAAESHEQWLSIVRFGLPTLLIDQEVLQECILREFFREAKKIAITPENVLDPFFRILKELRLTIAPITRQSNP